MVADDIAQRGLNAVIVPGSVGEGPTADLSIFHCAVRLQTTYYDTNRYGYVPQVRLLLLQYTVHARHNGLFVDAVGDPR